MGPPLLGPLQRSEAIALGPPTVFVAFALTLQQSCVKPLIMLIIKG